MGVPIFSGYLLEAVCVRPACRQAGIGVASFLDIERSRNTQKDIANSPTRP